MTPDPLDALRLPSEAVAPRAAFATALRGRIAAALTDPDPDDTIRSTAMTPTATRPTTVTALRPYLIVHDAAAALAFYTEALGATVTMRIDQPDGRIGHAELDLDGAAWMLADEFPERGIVGPRTLGGSPVSLHLELADVDTAFDRAVTAGATGESPPADQFHGNRRAKVTDPFGHQWMLSTRVEDLTADEIERRATTAEAGERAADER